MSAIARSARTEMTSEQSGRSETHEALRGKPSLSMIGLLVVEIVIGYEWFISGLVKIVRGDFPSGLAVELLEKSEGSRRGTAAF